MKELSDALLALELMPEKVRDLACNPTAGERYRWSYAAALSLIRCGYPFQLIEPLLKHYRGRPDNWAGELRAQIGNAANTILSCGSSDKPAIPTVAFTSMDADRVWSWLKEGRTLRSLTASSPSNPRLLAEEILRVLFPDNPYVCAALRSRDNQVKGRLSRHSSDFLRDCSFVVASTFNTEGKRKDENIAERRYFVVELDISAEHPAWTAVLADATKAGLTVRDLCAAALLYIGETFPLTMAVDSGPGGKSVHGWFFAPAIADHNKFCTIARKCGADRRITVPSQLWRMPWGTRRMKPEENVRTGKQPCLYLNPDYDR
jgi:hypothetical protein